MWSNWWMVVFFLVGFFLWFGTGLVPALLITLVALMAACFFLIVMWVLAVREFRDPLP